MSRLRVLSATVARLAIAAATTGIHASGQGRTLVVTMTNDQDSNQIKVYDAESQALIQTLSTHGRGGVGGNARGIKQYDGRLVAVVNNGSGDVALFRRDGDVLKFFIDNPIAAQIPTGAPADIDADSGVLSVIDHGAGQSHLSVFTFNRFGELAAAGPTITIGVPDANGVAILSPRADEQN